MTNTLQGAPVAPRNFQVEVSGPSSKLFYQQNLGPRKFLQATSCDAANPGRAAGAHERSRPKQNQPGNPEANFRNFATSSPERLKPLSLEDGAAAMRKRMAKDDSASSPANWLPNLRSSSQPDGASRRTNEASNRRSIYMRDGNGRRRQPQLGQADSSGEGGSGKAAECLGWSTLEDITVQSLSRRSGMNLLPEEGKPFMQLGAWLLNQLGPEPKSSRSAPVEPPNTEAANSAEAAATPELASPAASPRPQFSSGSAVQPLCMSTAGAVSPLDAEPATEGAAESGGEEATTSGGPNAKPEGSRDAAQSWLNREDELLQLDRVGYLDKTEPAVEPSWSNLLTNRARTLWNGIPITKHHPAGRAESVLLLRALKAALRQVGAPLSIRPLPMVQIGAADVSKEAAAVQQLQVWNPLQDLRPELQVWDRMLAELARQELGTCAERCNLIVGARERYWEMIQDSTGQSMRMKKDLLFSRQRLAQSYEEIADLRERVAKLQSRLHNEQSMVETLREELKREQDEAQAMFLKLRRGRFDIIEEQVTKYKRVLDQQVDALLTERLASLQSRLHEEQTAKEALREELRRARQEAKITLTLRIT